MKLTKENLRGMIKEVLTENREPSMLLNEAYAPQESHADSYSAIMDVLHGAGASSVGIMSAQNPMAEIDTSSDNHRLHQSLIRHVTSQGLRYIEVGGVFAGIPEDSLLIIDPSMDQMIELNKKYRQWGFVYGPAEGQELPSFIMMKMDVDSGQQHTNNPPSQDAGPVNNVLMHPETRNISNNFTYDKQSNQKFVIPLYGIPSEMTTNNKKQPED